MVAEKERLRKARASQQEVKEIQLRPVTDTHDLETKARRARAFLEDGDRVKITVKFMGREVTHASLGEQVLQDFLTLVGDHKLERQAALNDRQIQCFISSAPVVSPTKKG